MNKHLMGIIDATTIHEDLQELIVHRSVAAIPFGGRYRLIDFVLSNMVNSGIESVGIFPKFQYRSLMDHLGSGRDWDLNRKRDGLFFFPSLNLDRPNFGIGSLEHFAANIDFLTRSTQDYVVIANCFTVFNMDFLPLLDGHIDTGCDVTEVRHKNKSMGIYLMKTSLLIEMIEKRHETGYLSIKDIVTDIKSPLKMCYYDYTGFAVMIDSIKEYFSASMELLQQDVWKELYLKDRPILTKVKDEPPTRYLKGASVTNSIVANGSLIEGKVENSIIARGVRIGKGAVIKNSIIMQKSYIGEDCILESVILDKDVKVENGTVITAPAYSPYVIRKGTVQGAWLTS